MWGCIPYPYFVELCFSDIDTDQITLKAFINNPCLNCCGTYMYFILQALISGLLAPFFKGVRELSQKFVDCACNSIISCAKLQKRAYFQRILYFLSNCESSE